MIGKIRLKNVQVCLKSNICKKDKIKVMHISTRKISFVSLLIAMSIVLSRMASIRIAIGSVEGIRIGFGKLPIIMGGLMFGPLYGGIVGALSDMVGYIIQPIGPYMLHFTVISALVGILPFFLFRFLGGDDYHIIKLAITIGITTGITELFFIPYTLHFLFDIPWQVLIIPRLISVPVTILLYTYIIHIFIRRNVIQLTRTS